jgi:hypothetical protein
MRIAIPVFLAGVLIGLLAYYLTGTSLPGFGATEPSPAAQATTSATPPRAIVATLTAVPAGATPAASRTPVGTVIASNEGSPLTAARIIDAIQAAGMPVTGRDGRYTASVGNVQQPFTLAVFRSMTELQAEWNTQPGSAPQPRNGPAPALAFWNQNAVLTFSDGLDMAAARRVADAFLSVP